MDCKDAKKRIHEYLDGEADYAQIADHLKDCPACRAYFRDLKKQQELLGTLSAKNAPSFDLAAAKRRKKAGFSRTISWASAAAAVFVVVLLAGTMTGLFSGAKKEALSAKSRGTDEAGFELFDTQESAIEEAAPAPAEEAPAAEEAAEEEIMEEAAAEAPAEMEAAAPAEEAAAEEEAPAETDAPAAEIILEFSQDDLDALLADLYNAGYVPEENGTEYFISITEENAEVLNGIFTQYANGNWYAGMTVYFTAE